MPTCGQRHPGQERAELRLALGREVGAERIAGRQADELLDTIQEEAAGEARRLVRPERRAEARLHLAGHRHLRHGRNGNPAETHPPRSRDVG